MNFKQKNVSQLLVAKTDTKTATHTTNINSLKSAMVDGEAVLINAAGVTVDAATPATLAQNFKVAVKLSDGDIKLSGLIDAKQVNKVTVHKYTAGANQVDYIGYNGTSGSIDVIDNNVYKVNIYLRGTTALDFSRMQVKHGVYKSDSAATQEEIAAGLTNSLITNFSREGSKLAENIDVIKFERVHSAAGTEALGTSDTLVGTAGSKYVTIVETGGSLPYLFAVGDYIRMGTAVTSPVYKITATTVTVADGGVLTLDIPLQTSVSYSGTGAAEYITAAEAAAGSFGIKLTGAELPFQIWNKPYDRSTWTMGLQDFGSTVITNSTVMSLGSGYGKPVQELEAWCSMNAGRQYLNAVGVVYPTIYSSATGNYALVHIQYSDLYTTELGHQVNQHKELWIACVKGSGTTYSDANTGLGTAIDAYASKYSWDITYSGSTTTAGTIAA